MQQATRVIPEEGGLPISASAVQFEANGYLKILREEKEDLEAIYSFFVGEQPIWPDQCKRVIDLLRQISDSVQDLLRLLKTFKHIFCGNLLLMSLRNMAEQAHNLEHLLNSFRISCRQPSKQTKTSRREILAKLEQFAQTSDIALERAQFFIEELRARKKKPEEVNQEQLYLLSAVHAYEEQALCSKVPEEACRHLEEALRLVKKVGDRAWESRLLNELGRVYNTLERKEKASECFEKALQIIREEKSVREEGMVLKNLSMVYHDLGYHEEARSYLEQALAISKAIGDRLTEGRVLNGLGVIYEDRGEKELAQKYYESALQVRREAGDSEGEVVTLRGLDRLRDTSEF